MTLVASWHERYSLPPVRHHSPRFLLTTAPPTLHATRSADTEVFYMAGRQLGALSSKLLDAGWPADTPVCVVSRAGWPDRWISSHSVATLADAGPLHADRPAVVTVGAGGAALAASSAPSDAPDSTRT